MTWESLGGGIVVPTDEHCRFTADALLLARFAAPLPTEQVCDLGTGSGIIPLYWCRRDPPAHITAIEKEEAFFSLLYKAVAHNRLQERITPLCGDWTDTVLVPPSSFSLVTCNPPYFRYGASRGSEHPLRRAVRQEQHPQMLEELCRAAARMMREDGRFCLCHRPERLDDVFAALSSAGLRVRRLQSVHTTADAAARLVLIEAAIGGTTVMLPPLVEHRTGAATAVYHKVYTKETR